MNMPLTAPISRWVGPIAVEAFRPHPWNRERFVTIRLLALGYNLLVSDKGRPRKIVVAGSDFHSSQVTGIISDALPADLE
jgi:hypothetical protein